MINRFLASASLLLISVLVTNCQSSSHQPESKESQLQEMPRPASGANIDSLKLIQQHKRDSVKRARN